jgi:hypothetical protein
MRLPAEDQHAIDTMGHRKWVGGLWNEIGQLQFDFLLAQGLKPHHVLLDIACGSLRAGRLFIPYLDPGNYLGIEKHKAILDAGIEKEMDTVILNERHPEFVISSAFEFDKFTKTPDFCIAQSLFTHLSPRDIRLCLKQLRSFAKPECRFYATFFEGTWPRLNFLRQSHSHRTFFYTRRQMEAFGRHAGWSPRYIGGWDHPYNQKMIQFVG